MGFIVVAELILQDLAAYCQSFQQFMGQGCFVLGDFENYLVIDALVGSENSNSTDRQNGRRSGANMIRAKLTVRSVLPLFSIAAVSSSFQPRGRCLGAGARRVRIGSNAAVGLSRIGRRLHRDHSLVLGE